MKKMWVMRRLKKLGASSTDLLEIYYKQIRCIAEYAAPVWSSALTKEDSGKLERIQKVASNIILGENYESYSAAIKLFGIEKLSERRKKICTKFARKSQKHSKFTKWFRPVPTLNTRQKKPKFYNVFSNTVRFEKSPISYLTQLLNQ